MRRRSLPALAASLAGPVLAPPSCASRPMPTRLALRVSASDDVNPDGAGMPKPIRVRILQLAGIAALSRASFFALDADPAKVLGTDLLASEDVLLGPGQAVTLEQEAKPGTLYLGVVGAFFAIESARWQAWAPVRPGARNAYVARLGTAAAAITKGET
ncbi:type VI secretion system lipoprotein TssJ [Belnapia sp. T6]|uniref:Type VI secretion system lipoprotein TssJ n=1 Tax=Belnapia mucosa TaxID=2804532 RepID=A0ABS1VAF3_9PROT|nr:type VI secretion system lipoprotein TssJ [Belnapia mucosa]MBL6458656.1 type VI secretion system lipoprotein TssJ [Belnapia mucosa]